MNGHSLETADVRPYMSLAGVAGNAAKLFNHPAVSLGLRKASESGGAKSEKNEEDDHG